MSIDMFDIDISERTANTNQFKNMEPRRLQLIAGMLSIGLGRGIILNQQAALWYMDAQAALAEHAENQNRPKPPKGKTRRVVGFALGNT